MCGRYTLRTSWTVLVDYFEVDATGLVPFLRPYSPRFNIAPSQQVPAIVFDAAVGARSWRSFAWGLVPRWANDPSIGNRMLNARSETAAEKPSFREALKRRRCLIPADGFYEWRRVGKAKQPFHIRPVDGRPFAFAGLYERWQGNGLTIESCTILTTGPNELMAPIHDRMPVIVDRESYGAWLDPLETDAARVQLLLRSAPAAGWEAVPVSQFVNNARNEGPECLSPAEA